MNAQEYKHEEERLNKYNALEQQKKNVQSAIEAITTPWTEQGPCGQGPFTGNTRESRMIESISIQFTKTRGGAAEVKADYHKLYIEAYEFGKYLENLLHAKLKYINEQMEKI